MSPTPSAVPPEPRVWPVAGTGLAGALIVALALPASTRMETSGVPRWLVVAAVILAVLTVTAAVGAVVLRGAGRFRELLAVAAGLLLIAATAFTGSAAAAALAGGPPPAATVQEGLTVVLSGVGDDARLTLRAEVPDVAAGALVRAEVVAVQEIDGQLVLAQQVTVARTAGPVSVDLTATRVGGFDALQILVESPDRRCTARVRPLVSENPVVSCNAR